MKQYKMISIDNDDVPDYHDTIWDSVPKAEINHYPWGGEYQPYAVAQLVCTSAAFHLRMEAIEPHQNMRITESGISQKVYQDSCLEFFFMPCPASDSRYLNFEINPAGATLVGIGTGRSDRLFIGEQAMAECRLSPSIHNIDTSLVKWGYTLSIPYSFIQKYCKEFNITSTNIMKCNFYKCGDFTQIPHYGSWNPIISERPDFHRPEFFGELYPASLE